MGEWVRGPCGPAPADLDEDMKKPDPPTDFSSYLPYAELSGLRGTTAVRRREQGVMRKGAAVDWSCTGSAGAWLQSGGSAK